MILKKAKKKKKFKKKKTDLPPAHPLAIVVMQFIACLSEKKK